MVMQCLYALPSSVPAVHLMQIGGDVLKTIFVGFVTETKNCLSSGKGGDPPNMLCWHSWCTCPWHLAMQLCPKLCRIRAVWVLRACMISSMQNVFWNLSANKCMYNCAMLQNQPGDSPAAVAQWMAEEQVECSLLQHPYKKSFKGISFPDNDLDALTDLSADEVEALQALEVLKSANPPAAACCDARSSLSGAFTSSTLFSSLLGPDSTPRKGLLLATSFANRAVTGITSAGQAATNSSAQSPSSSSSMGLQRLQPSTAARLRP